MPQKAYGVQSLETNAPMRLDTIARIHSMTKPVAGVALMMLYDEGRWQPSDPIAKHTPEFANLKVYAGDKDGAPPLDAPSLQEFINRMAQLPLLYQPGTRWVYRVSVDIQGYLVEKLSGKTFPEFLRTRLFEPLGMVDTGFFVPSQKRSRVATIYAYDKAKAALVSEPANPGISQMPGLPSGGGGFCIQPPATTSGSRRWF